MSLTCRAAYEALILIVHTAFYLTSDVLEVNRVLLDLQEDDEIAQDAWTSRRLSTGTRTRKAKEVVEAPKSLVDAFVQEKRAEAAARVDVSTKHFSTARDD